MTPAMPTARQNTAEPARPSHVLAGLMCGASACRPNRTPAA